MSAPIVSNLGRSIWKAIEPITIAALMDAGKTVKLDLVDVATDTILQTALTFPESARIPGLYRLTLSITTLDTYLSPTVTERLIAWRAYAQPTDVAIPDRVGTFYRGGHVDLPVPAYIAPFDAAYASQADEVRFVEPGDVDHVDVALGYSKILRRMLTYRAGSDDIASTADEVIPA